MTRTKTKIEYIVNRSARIACFRKRSKSLLKKMSEITTLCDVPAFIVIYGPDNRPVVWPSQPVIRQLFQRFENVPDRERNKKMMTQESYLKERTIKVEEQLKKKCKRNQELEMDDVMYKVLKSKAKEKLRELETSELIGLCSMVEQNIWDTRKRMERLKGFINPFPQGSLFRSQVHDQYQHGNPRSNINGENGWGRQDELLNVDKDGRIVGGYDLNLHLPPHENEGNY